MDNLTIAFALGWFFGAITIWIYLKSQKLIRSPKEWYAAMDKEDE